MSNIRKAEIRNVKVTGLTGPLISLHYVNGNGLEGATPIEGPKPPETVAAPAISCQLH